MPRHRRARPSPEAPSQSPARARRVAAQALLRAAAPPGHWPFRPATVRPLLLRLLLRLGLLGDLSRGLRGGLVGARCRRRSAARGHPGDQLFGGLCGNALHGGFVDQRPGIAALLAFDQFVALNSLGPLAALIGDVPDIGELRALRRRRPRRDSREPYNRLPWPTRPGCSSGRPMRPAARSSSTKPSTARR